MPKILTTSFEVSSSLLGCSPLFFRESSMFEILSFISSHSLCGRMKHLVAFIDKKRGSFKCSISLYRITVSAYGARLRTDARKFYIYIESLFPLDCKIYTLYKGIGSYWVLYILYYHKRSV